MGGRAVVKRGSNRGQIGARLWSNRGQIGARLWSNRGQIGARLWSNRGNMNGHEESRKPPPRRARQRRGGGASHQVKQTVVIWSNSGQTGQIVAKPVNEWSKRWERCAETHQAAAVTTTQAMILTTTTHHQPPQPPQEQGHMVKQWSKNKPRVGAPAARRRCRPPPP